LDLHLSLIFKTDVTQGADEVSARRTDQGNQVHDGGDAEVIDAKGLASVAYYLHLDNTRAKADYIVTGKRIDSINTANDPVVIHAEGDPLLTVTQCGTVIVTVPLGVLKKKSGPNSIQWTPALSPRKQNAIDKLGFGTLNKLFLKWNTMPVGWPQLFGDYSFAYVAKGGDNYFPSVINAMPVYGSPTLVFLSGGHTADDLEQQSVDVLVARAMPIAKKLLQLDTLPNPDLAYMTKWHSNPNAFGAYTFVPPGAWNGKGQAATVADDAALDLANVNPFQDYRRNIRGKVFFAGEGTMSTRYGYVDGAYLSGVAVAKAILGGKNDFYYDEVTPVATDDECKCVDPANVNVLNDVFPATWANQKAKRNADCDGGDAKVLKQIRFRGQRSHHGGSSSQGMRFKSETDGSHQQLGLADQGKHGIARHLKAHYRRARAHRHH